MNRASGEPRIIRPLAPPVALDVACELDRAYAESDSMASFLGAAAAANEPVLLMVNDSHRATLTREVLAALARWTARLAPVPRFRAIVATGTHRFGRAEQAAFEAAELCNTGLTVERIEWHDALDDRRLAPVAGLRMNHEVAAHRFLLPIGSVEPHYFAGATGPHKTLTIGCLAHADIERNHARALDPASDILRLHGNPVHDGVADMVRALQDSGKRTCAVGEVLCGRALVRAAIGDPLIVTERLMSDVRRTFVQFVDRPADVVRLRVPMPLGRSLYQADKALKNNHRAVRDGGGMILEAACPDGVGNDAFLSMLRIAADHATAVRLVEQEGYRLGDHKAVKLRFLTDPRQRGVHVALVASTISGTDAHVAGMMPCPDAEAARDWLRSVVQGPTDQQLIIEDAGMVTVSAEAGQTG